MNKHQQSGMTTLLITSMLLIVALLFSLASYKNLFYQIKRTQNEVLARQAHWAAEGGLECGFAEISNKSDVNTSLDKCKTVIDGLPLILSIDTNDGKSLLTSETSNKYKKIVKTIVAGGTRSSGVIKSSADLYFNGDYRFFPDPGKGLGSNQWECVLLRYRNNVFIHDDGNLNTGFGSNDLSFTSPPYLDFFKDSNDHKCSSSTDANYRTPLASNYPSKFESDIQKESMMDLFKETFGVARDDWMSVRSRPEFVEVDPTDGCGKKIAEVVKEDKRHVWVNGSCILDRVGLNLLQDKASSLKGLFILVHNGIFSFNGAEKLNALVYHFNNDYDPVINGENIWNSTLEKDKVLKDDMYQPTEGELTVDEIKNKVVFYMYGSFLPSGGFILDTPEYVSYFNASGNFAFDGELITDLLAPFGKPRWQQGSWHDF
ncbi:hypothetical protein [Photobacterium aquimaris]|uniref:Uncharacterized protein n=1 Tax=Photobacterium aquimaris TaxID=512643 RepID=A0A2T3HSN6_9GAMM|nr:hypothetical protein [Photobacterium aquimaris]OBU17772.1 hypothetical protein AYY21_19630 [Photobacterium aquimaris]PQJ40331.1 hypothetical protein BTN98_01210 [Photobacterium aquimaris]PST97496.1 hypothetical protein C0W81_19580 [Photobacterium aquimaris]